MSQASKVDWSEQFKALLLSPLGEELVRTLKEDLRASVLEDAEKANSSENAFGLLKEARGVIRSIEHLQFRADTGQRITPKDEGSKAN